MKSVSGDERSTALFYDELALVLSKSEHTNEKLLVRKRNILFFFFSAIKVVLSLIIIKILHFLK